MRARRRRAFVPGILLVTTGATTTITVDDGDPGIAYRGDWTHNPWGNQNVNYGSSVTFTNTSGSTATYSFQGTAIAVYGTFEMSGTFNVHSSYSIDGGTATDFIPANTFVSFQYNQKFFQSDTLSNDEHTLLITNLGEEFWFDYLVVTQSSPSTTSTTPSIAPQTVQSTSSSTTLTTPSTTNPPTTTSASQPPGTTPSPSSASSRMQSTQPSSNVANGTLTSSDAAVLSPSSTSQSGTSEPASGVASPTSTATSPHFTKLPAGEIAGLAVACVLALILVGIVAYRYCCRRHARGRNKLEPYDPRLTAPASWFSEKRNPGHEHHVSRGGPADPPAQSAPDHLQSSTHARAQRSADEGGAGYGTSTTSHAATETSRDRRTLFEPLGSPSSASPLLTQQREKTEQPTGAPPTSADSSRYVVAWGERRRSVDGGVRIAGGPPGSLTQEDLLGHGDAEDVQSVLSTLPPSYQVYPGS